MLSNIQADRKYVKQVASMKISQSLHKYIDSESPVLSPWDRTEALLATWTMELSDKFKVFSKAVLDEIFLQVNIYSIFLQKVLIYS